MSISCHSLPEPQADDVAFDALLECFRLCGGFATPNTLRVFTLCPIPKLVAAGWLREGMMGRWMEGYEPDGALKTALETDQRAAPRGTANY